MNPPPPANDNELTTSEAAGVESKKWNWLAWVGMVSILIIILGLAIPPMTRARKINEQTEVVNNARQIGLALFEFSVEYGDLPDESTISSVRENHPTDLHLGTKTSNDFFRQLIVAKIAMSETIFFAKIKNSRKPDNIITTGEALKKGECGYSYLLAPKATGIGLRPLIVTPLIPGTTRFDPKPFKGKAMILRMDNSVTSLPIREDGHVWIDGMNFLDPNHPLWAGKPPVIAYPE